jgi:hypothetical protein
MVYKPFARNIFTGFANFTGCKHSYPLVIL